MALAINIKQADLRAAALIAVSYHDDPFTGDQHLVIPGVMRIDVRSERIDGRNRLQRAVAHGDCEQTPAPQNYQMIAVQFDDAALIDPGVLSVRDGLFALRLRIRIRRRGFRRRRGLSRPAAASRPPEFALRLFSDLPEIGRQLLLGSKRA